MVRRAIILGAERAFGREIVERLERDNYRVTVGDDMSGAGSDPLDLLVFNRPLASGGVRFRDISDDDFLAAMDDQLTALVAAGQAAAPLMSSGGSIVVVASRAHLGAWAGADRVAAGASLVGMTRSMALELAGITVNLIAPEFVGEPGDTPEARAAVAGTVAWLAGPDARFVTGETILLNAGRSLRMTETARR